MKPNNWLFINNTVQNVQTMFRMFRLCSEFSFNVQNLQNLMRYWSECSDISDNVQTLFSQCSECSECSVNVQNVQNLFRMFGQCSECSESVQTFSEFLAQRLVYSEYLDFVVTVTSNAMNVMRSLLKGQTP
jgi:hypothetical protein